MSFITRGLGPMAANADRIDDERMWSPGPVYGTATGLTITPSIALQVSCVFQSVRLYAETLSTLPLILYRESEDGRRKDRARDHHLWKKLRKQPNPRQTAQQWRETMTARAFLWGAGLSEILVDRAGDLTLEPLDPDWVTTEFVKSTRRLRYIVREPGEAPRTLVQDQVFRLEGMSIHQFMPLNLLLLAREAVGLWLAIEKFNALYFAQGASPSVWLQHPEKLSDPAWKRLQESVQQKYGGMFSAHKAFVVEEGITVKDVGRSAKDSQIVESKESQVHEVGRWCNIPLHMLRAGDAPTYASIEMFAQEFVDYSLRPWAVRWEQCIGRDLLPEDDVYAEHLFEGLLRGNTADRFNAYAIAIMNGFMAENEVRSREGLNPWPGLDEPRRSVNQDRGAAPQGAGSLALPKKKKKKRAADDEEQAKPPAPPRRLALLARNGAQRVVRREVGAIGKRAVDLAGKPDAWSKWLAEFYGEHASFVGDALQLEPALATDYAERHRAAVLAEGVGVLERWDLEAVEELTSLAIG